MFSYFFDTPIEHSLKQSTEQLSGRYEELRSSLDSINRVISNIERRDSSIFEIVFEAKPMQDTVSEFSYLKRSDLEGYSGSELSVLFDSRIEAMNTSVTSQSLLMLEQLKLADSLRSEMNRIPSIQPIDNRDLTLLAASYGYRIHPFYKTRHFHRGVDFAVPVGTAVFATADGMVQSIQTKGQTSGLGITVNHGRFKTFYGNLDKVLVRAGTQVMKGDIIAFSGDSGLSYAPHLHYEVHLDGVQVDPLPYFFAELTISQTEKLQQIASVAMQSFD
ncbi:MAG: M23 family metallopeptidase [Rikenellaceae bacterium]